MADKTEKTMTIESGRNGLSLDKRHAHAAVGLASLIVARKIYAKEFNPKEVTEAQFWKILLSIGRTHDNAFEVHIDHIPRKSRGRFRHGLSSRRVQFARKA